MGRRNTYCFTHDFVRTAAFYVRKLFTLATIQTLVFWHKILCPKQNFLCKSVGKNICFWVAQQSGRPKNFSAHWMSGIWESSVFCIDRQKVHPSRSLRADTRSGSSQTQNPFYQLSRCIDCATKRICATIMFLGGDTDQPCRRCSTARRNLVQTTALFSPPHQLVHSDLLTRAVERICLSQAKFTTVDVVVPTHRVNRTYLERIVITVEKVDVNFILIVDNPEADVAWLRALAIARTDLRVPVNPINQGASFTRNVGID